MGGTGGSASISRRCVCASVRACERDYTHIHTQDQHTRVHRAGVTSIDGFIINVISNAADVESENELYTLEDGLDLWLAFARNLPKASPPLLALFPLIPKVLTRDFDHLQVVFVWLAVACVEMRARACVALVVFPGHTHTHTHTHTHMELDRCSDMLSPMYMLAPALPPSCTCACLHRCACTSQRACCCSAAVRCSRLTAARLVTCVCRCSGM
jgi:hypothetical protein